MPTMVHKSPTVDARQAAGSAFEYFNALFSRTSGLLDSEPFVDLEEIELSKDGRYWLVTLGFNARRPKDTRLPDFLRVPLRKLKVFKVDAVTGRVLSMKIPEDE
jgi:hypothetical protein